MNKLRDTSMLDLFGDTYPLIMTRQIRYNNRNRIHNEDLAQHSFMVAYNILKVAYYYKIPNDITYKAASMAIVHDYPETYTADIPHDCKVKYPELRELLSKIEIDFIKEEVPELEELYKDYLKGDSVVTTLVDLGDAISVLQYVNREINHGNKDKDMEIIKNEVSVRIINLLNKLDKEVQPNGKRGRNRKANKETK